VLKSSTVFAWTFSQIPEAADIPGRGGRHSSKQFAGIATLPKDKRPQQVRLVRPDWTPMTSVRWSGGATAEMNEGRNKISIFGPKSGGSHWLELRQADGNALGVLRTVRNGPNCSRETIANAAARMRCNLEAAMKRTAIRVEPIAICLERRRKASDPSSGELNVI
jgi:hypothetical protein